MTNTRLLTEKDIVLSKNKIRSFTSIGGITENTDLTNMSVKEIVKQMLMPETKAGIESLTVIVNGKSTDSTSNYETGSSVELNSVSGHIIPMSYPVTKYEIITQLNGNDPITIKLVNKELFQNDKDVILINNTFVDELNKEEKLIIFNEGNENDTLKYYVKVYDEEGLINASGKSITFISAYYYCNLSESITITENNIKNLLTNYATKVLKKLDANISITYPISQSLSYPILVYPKSYGKLIKIIDNNNFNQTWELLMNGDKDYFTINNLNKETDYYVYKGDSSVTDSATTYKFQLPISSLPNDENGDLTRMIETIVAQELNESVPRIVENVIDTATLIGSDSI